MKKLIAMLLAVLMLCALTACGENTDNPTTLPQKAEGFTFTYQGVALVPGAEFDAAALPQVESFENPNCAGEGKFITYLHDTMELTVNTNGDKTVIYSIYLTDANTPTAEGLYQGDDAATVTNIYGSTYTEDGTKRIYKKGTTTLELLIENDQVTSIEYRIA